MPSRATRVTPLRQSLRTVPRVVRAEKRSLHTPNKNEQPMRSTFRLSAAAVVAAAVLAVAAEPSFGQKADPPREEASSSGSASTAPIGGDTPEETFKLATAALAKEDWKSFSLTMTQESQNMMAGGMAMAGMVLQAFGSLGGEEIAEQAKSLQKVLDKHGLDEAFLKKVQDDGAIQSPEEGMKKLVAPIKNRPQFIADMMAAMKSMKGFKDTGPLDKDAKLVDVKIDGERAKAKIEFVQGGQKKSEPIAFKKVSGKWLMDITEAMKAALGGPPPGIVPAE